MFSDYASILEPPFDVGGDISGGKQDSSCITKGKLHKKEIQNGMEATISCYNGCIVFQKVWCLTYKEPILWYL